MGLRGAVLGGSEGWYWGFRGTVLGQYWGSTGAVLGGLPVMCTS